MLEDIFKLVVFYFVGFFLPDATWKLGSYIRLKKFGVLNEPLYYMYL